MPPDLHAGGPTHWIRRMTYGSALVVVVLTIFIVCTVILLNWQMREQIEGLPRLATSGTAESTPTMILDRQKPDVSLGERMRFVGLLCLGLVLSGSLAWRLATGRGLLPRYLVTNARLPYGLGMFLAVVGHVLIGITLLAAAILLPDLQANSNADPDVLAIPIMLALVAYAGSVACIEASIGIQSLRGR